MKKTIGLCTFILIYIIAIPTVLAAASVILDKTSALPGETVLISGTAGSEENIVIKINDEVGNIVYIDAVKTDTSGKYSASFVVPSDIVAGKLTVIAGSGSDIATTTFSVTSPLVVTPTPVPSASADARASSSASACAPSASADASALSSASACAPSASAGASALSSASASPDGWIMAICIAIGLLIMAVVLWILIRTRNKQKQAD